MEPSTVALIFGLLLLLGAIGLVGGLLSARARQVLRANGSKLAAAIAVGATAGSLYFSEIAGYVPCELCWYQRIAMYPLAIVGVGAALTGDRSAKIHTLILSTIGLGIALFHVQLQAFPEQKSFCEIANPCTDSPIKAFGFLTIPQMSALSFAGIVILTVLSHRPRQASQ